MEIKGKLKLEEAGLKREIEILDGKIEALEFSGQKRPDDPRMTIWGKRDDLRRQLAGVEDKLKVLNEKEYQEGEFTH